MLHGNYIRWCDSLKTLTCACIVQQYQLKGLELRNQPNRDRSMEMDLQFAETGYSRQERKLETTETNKIPTKISHNSCFNSFLTWLILDEGMETCTKKTKYIESSFSDIKENQFAYSQFNKWMSAKNKLGMHYPERSITMYQQLTLQKLSHK